MKRLLSLLSLLFVASAGAATLNPVQLLNPAGSTAGQAIISSGPSTPPAWATVSVSAPTGTLPVANGGTGATTAATARTNLGAAATASPLSQFAATTSAQLLSVLSDETGTGVAVFGTSPTIATPNITGVVTVGNAAAGSVGEYLTNSTTGTPLTTGTSANCTSVSLTAGDWDVSGVIQFVPAAGTITQVVTLGVSTSSAALAGLGQTVSFIATTNAGVSQIVSTPVVRVNVATTTTAYVVGNAGFTTSTMTCSGFIRARRIR